MLQADYMRTARAKRLPDRLLYLRHALPNSLTATLTLAGLLLCGMVAGTVLVENVFAWPGLGSTIVAVDPGQGLPGGPGRRARVRRSACCWSTSPSTCALALLDPRSTIRES